MPLDVLNTILPPSAAECEDSSLVHPFQPPASSRARLSGSLLDHPVHCSFDVSCCRTHKIPLIRGAYSSFAHRTHVILPC